MDPGLERFCPQMAQRMNKTTSWSIFMRPLLELSKQSALNSVNKDFKTKIYPC